MTRVTGRNILVLVGAYYLSILVGMPFFILFAKLTEGHVYRGDIGSLVSTLVSAIPLAVDAALAGLMAGWLIESARPFRWALGFAGVLFLASLSSHHWKISPGLIDRLGEFLEATIIGVVAVPAFMFARRRVRRVRDAA
jgi:hypothetical protein